MATQLIKNVTAEILAQMMLGHYENPMYGPIEWFDGAPHDDECIDYLYELKKLPGDMYSDDYKELRVNVMRKLMEMMQLEPEDLY